MMDQRRQAGSAWLKRRVWGPIREQMRQGLSPKGLAWSLCMAMVCATCPVIGATTALCVAAGMALRLNHPVMQVVNYLSYPIQIALLIPFWRLGEALFGAPSMNLHPAAVFAALKHDPRGAMAFYGTEAWHGVAAWALVAIPIGCLSAWGLGALLARRNA